MCNDTIISSTGNNLKYLKISKSQDCCQSELFWFRIGPKMRWMYVLVCCFTSQATAMVILGPSVHLITLFSWESLNKQLTSTSCTHFRLSLTTTFLNELELSEYLTIAPLQCLACSKRPECLRILSGNVILTSIKGHNSLTNCKK